MNANEITNPSTCAECGCIEEELFLVDGQYYCPDCLERKGYVRCEECGEWLQEDDAHPHEDGYYVCPDCSDQLGLKECENCGEWTNDYAEVFGRYHARHNYCRSCLSNHLNVGALYLCEDCDRYYEESYRSSYITHDGNTICEDCYEQNYRRCPDCDEIFNLADMFWSERDEEYFCETCFCENGHDTPEDDGDRSSIHEYSYKPYPEFHGLSHPDDPMYGDPITMGFELEVDKGDRRYSCAEAIDSEFGDDVLYMKADGSVDFEIVTHPHTLTAYLHDLDFDRLCEIPKEYGYKSHDAGTCGFHIHVGRTQLGRNTAEINKVIYRIALLMYRVWPALVKFSRRNQSQLSRWASPPEFRFDDYCIHTEAGLEKIVNDYYYRASRYQALNLQPRGTIEFRLWRGSLTPQTIKATLQLTSNLVMFAKEHTMYDVVNASWDDITNYETFPELEAYLKERDLESFSDLRSIPWEETITIVDPADFKFHPGDSVRIVNDGGPLVASAVVGATGEIVYSRIAEDGLSREYAIEFDDRVGTNVRYCYGHTCEGRTGCGYWAYEQNLALDTPNSSNAVSF
jgi:hypothetical protein